MNGSGYRRPVVLVGLPGSGKTHVGERLAARLGCSFIDTDHEVTSSLGQTVAEIVAQRGWRAFRREEEKALAAALEQGAGVIASGGGCVESAVNRDVLKRLARVVWLCAGPRCLLGRLAADAGARPLLCADPAHRLAEIKQRREPLYAGLSLHRIDTDDLGVEQVVERIALVLAASPDGNEHEAID